MALKLNLGSGDMRLPGFINVDLYDESADVKADICNLPYDESSVDEIVAYQVIEHIPYQNSQKVFEEMYRVLKPGGCAIVETPDIQYVAKQIITEGLKDKWIYNLVGEYYRPWDKNRYKDWEMNAASIHRNPWDFERIKRTASEAGFKIERNTKKHPLYQYPENLSVVLTKPKNKTAKNKPVKNKVGIALIIPCYWLNEHLVQLTINCLRSLEDSAEPDLIVVINDGSPLKLDLKKISKELKTVNLVSNSGYPVAVNAGLEYAKKYSPDVYIIANNDIEFFPGWLEAILKPLNHGYDISSLATSDQGWEARDEITSGDRFGSLWAMKAKVYDKLGSLDESFGTGTFEDADYYESVKKAGFKIGKNWSVVVQHHGRATFDAVDPNHQIFEANKQKFIKKHGKLI